MNSSIITLLTIIIIITISITIIIIIIVIIIIIIYRIVIISSIISCRQGDKVPGCADELSVGGGSNAMIAGGKRKAIGPSGTIQFGSRDRGMSHVMYVYVCVCVSFFDCVCMCLIYRLSLLSVSPRFPRAPVAPPGPGRRGPPRLRPTGK